jgi:hypothetical protein
MGSASGSTVTFADFMVIFVLIAIALSYARSQTAEVEFVVSSVDRRRYLVRKLRDSQKAADALARVNAKLQALVRHMVAKFGTTDESVRRLYENYDPDALSEGSEESGYTSYSVNKGEKIVLCIRQRDERKTLVDDNVVAYVAIHELAHLMTYDEVGHTPAFWANFRTLLAEAVDLGLYAKTDYASKPVDYCGIKITSSVL